VGQEAGEPLVREVAVAEGENRGRGVEIVGTAAERVLSPVIGEAGEGLELLIR
jgi:hypothetical protein